MDTSGLTSTRRSDGGKAKIARSKLTIAKSWETRGVFDLHQTALNLSERGPRRGPRFRRFSLIGR